MKRFLAAFLVTIACLSAQEFRATITGVIQDPSGAPVPNAKVVATNIASNISSEAVSNDQGRYTIGFLVPGAYTVSTEASGFKKVTRENIVLGVSDRKAIDFNLEVGQLADSVTVSESVSLLQTETASRLAFVEQNLIRNIPNNGRNPFLLTHALPGVIKTGYWGSAELYAYGQVNGVSISGGRPGENETVIDGVTNTRPSREVSFIPALDSLAEISVQTNVYDAQFARTGGGVNVFSTKSGTNRLHGAAYEHLKHEKLNALGWSTAKALAEYRAANPGIEPYRKFRNNTYGFEVDGPIFIPKVFDGRNRMFFMLSFEGLQERRPSGQMVTLPTAAQRTGDFSGLVNNAGQPIIIYDPLLTDPVTGIRQPFPGNRIPANRINPISARVTSFLPQPNTAGQGLGLLNNHVSSGAARNSYNQWIGKLDYRINSSNSVFFRYGETPWANFARVQWGDNPAEPSNEAPSTRESWTYAADWTSTISPTLVFNLRGGLARRRNFGGNTFGLGYDPRELGFDNSLVSQFGALQFPRFQFVGTAYTPIGSPTNSIDISDTYSLQPNFNWVKGNHVMKIGFEGRRYNQNNIGPGYSSGLYEFGRLWTQRDALRPEALAGNEFASFLLGYPTTGSVDRNIDTAYSWMYYAGYIQDDWKLSQRLTLNVGLRWDYEAPAKERFDRMITGFAFDQASPIASQVQGINLRGGLLYAAGSGNDTEAFERDLNNWQPRIGVAFRATDKMVVRGGYGLVYLGQNAVGPTTGFSRPTSLIRSSDSDFTPRVNISNAFPEGLLAPIGSSRGLATNLGLGVNFPYRNRPLPYSQQYSFGFQHELPFGLRADISYVGNLTRKLPLNVDLNAIPASELGRPTSYYTERIANPLAGRLPDNPARNAATIPRQDLLLPYPQYTSVTATNIPIGSQRYDALQTSLVKRFSSGFSLSTNFTWGKIFEEQTLLNAQDFNLADPESSKLEKRLAEYDAKYHIGILAAYELPFGKSRRFASDMHPIANFVLGGWNLSGNYNKRGGPPLDFPNALPLTSESPRLTSGQRDELARGAPYNKEKWDLSYVPYFDITKFPRTAGPAPYTLRNFPTRFGSDIRGFGLNNLDLNIAKTWSIAERARFEYRAEIMNVMNTTYFRRLDANGNNVTNQNFGLIRQDPTVDGRIVAMVLRLTW